MGLLRKLFGRRKPLVPKSVTALRVCRFEEMERRQLLSVAPIQIGAVYFEDSAGEDQTGGDTIQITFSGGAPGTQLVSLEIDTDKVGDGPTIGDVFFDTAAGGTGAYAFDPLIIRDHAGIDSVHFSVVDGGQTLRFDFVGFDPGEKLVLTVDVDEFGFLGANAVAEGNEFEGSKLSATFQADHYFEASGNDMFLDFYDSKLTPSGLSLPPDSYVPPGQQPRPVYTAGAVFSVAQNPLPITLSGNVFEDMNANNIREPGDSGIANVDLTLLNLVNGQYVATGRTTKTDAAGHYEFDNLAPGTYRVVETQPSGYLSVGARAGTVGGQTRGTVTSVDVLSGIELLGGDDSVLNDFAEARPASVSGHVFHDANADDLYSPGDQPIGNVTLELLDASGNVLRTTTTANTGAYQFTGLLPGQYGVHEVQPAGYLDSVDFVGTAGGDLANDRIGRIVLRSGQTGENYDFLELRPNSIRGTVIADMNGSGLYDPGDLLLAGVTVELLDAQGQIIRTTLTDSDGRYAFTELPRGFYGVHEVQPIGYFDSIDKVGSVGGRLEPTDSILAIALYSDTHGVDYDFYEVAPSSLSGRVVADRNGNCQFDPGDRVLAGVTLHLRDAQGNLVATQVTDQNGEYAFLDLPPGTYQIDELQPQGYFDACDKVGSAGGEKLPPDSITKIPLVSNTHGVRYDFYEIEPVSISGHVYEDANDNGIREPGERPIAGVTLTLLDANGQPTSRTTHTDASGYYRFDGLRPGVYGVSEIQPGGYLDGKDAAGSVGGTANNPGDSITGARIPFATDAVDYDFGEIPPAKLSGYVYQDGATIRYQRDQTPPDPYQLRDGRLTADDKRLAGVRLTLGDEFGRPVLLNGQPRVTYTNAQGYYEFTNLPPGTYTVLESQPTGYVDGNDRQGNVGGMAVNPDLPQEQMDMIAHVMQVDVQYDAIVLIPIMAGDNAVYYNFSEVKLESYAPPKVPPSDPPQWPGPIQPPPQVRVPDEAARPLLAAELPPEPVYLPIYGSAGAPPAWTWHLSVVNAGRPRRDSDGNAALYQTAGYLLASEWKGLVVDQGTFILADGQGAPMRVFQFGVVGAVPVAGDFNGDGISEVGVYRNGTWLLDLNGSGSWDNDDLWARLGSERDLPVIGDWDYDGKSDIGIFGPEWPGDPRALAHEPGLPDAANRRLGELSGRFKNIPPDPNEATSGLRALRRTSLGKIRTDLIDHVFRYGNENDKPVAGDWNGDGVSNVGVFREGTWYLDIDGDGQWSASDQEVQYGQAGDKPVVGDWTGDGVDKLGVYRGGVWYLDTNNNRALDEQDRVLRLGSPNDLPVVGDWNGDGVDEIGVYQPGSDAAASEEAPPADAPAAPAA